MSVATALIMLRNDLEGYQAKARTMRAEACKLEMLGDNTRATRARRYADRHDWQGLALTRSIEGIERYCA